MSVSPRTMARIRWHAGFEDIDEPAARSISACTAPDRAAGELPGAVLDFVRTLGRVNTELNGPMPSESPARRDTLPRTLVYAVTESLRMLRALGDGARDAEEREQARRAAWRAEAAWSAVLAGDIDDLEAHVRLEERMRAS